MLDGTSQERIASCPRCRSVVVLLHFFDERVEPIDPDHLARRGLMSSLGMPTWSSWISAGQGWGAGYCESHVCPPDQLRAARRSSIEDVRRN